MPKKQPPRRPRGRPPKWRERYEASEKARRLGNEGWLSVAVAARARAVETMHYDREGIGLGWRWRLCALRERFRDVLSLEDLAWGTVEGNEVRRDQTRYDNLNKVKRFMSSGDGALDDKETGRLLDYLEGQMGLRDRRPILAETGSLDAFCAGLEALALHAATVVSSDVDLDALDDTAIVDDDDRRRLLEADMRGFLEVPETGNEASAGRHKPVFMVYGEYDRCMQSFVRKLLEDYAESDGCLRRMIAVDARNLSGADLAHALLEKPQRLDAQAFASAASGGRDATALAAQASGALTESPAIVVIAHFEPVLMGLDGASVHAAIRNNTGLYDMFSRIVHNVSNESRFIVLVDRMLTRVDASYLHDVRLFTGLQPDRPRLSELIVENARKERASSGGGSRAPEALTRCFAAAERHPGDTLEAVLIALGRRRPPDSAWVEMMVRSNALEAAVHRWLQELDDPWLRSMVLAAAMAEDRIEFESLETVLALARCCPGFRDEGATQASPEPLAGVEALAKAAAAELPGLIRQVPIFEKDLHASNRPGLDLDAAFRDAVIALCERKGGDRRVLDWCRSVRLQVAILASNQDDTLRKYMPDASLERDPAVFRRAILAIVLCLAAIDPQALASEEHDDHVDARLDLELGKTYTASRLMHWCHDYVRELEDGESYRLSSNYAGHQLKLQIWLCFQHPGFARSHHGVRYRERRGPSLLPPGPVPSFSREQNLEMFASLAIGALGAHELDYGDMVLSAADSFVSNLEQEADGETPVMEHARLALLVTKLWKRQCDLLVRRAQLEDAETFVRERLEQTGFGPDPAWLASLPATREEPMRPLGDALAPVSRYPVWSRLLGRLGEVLRLRGAGRAEEALRCFRLAEALDDVYERYVEAGQGRAPARGLNGRPARAKLRQLCALARNGYARKRENLAAYVAEAESVSRRRLTASRDMPLDGINTRVDQAILRYAKLFEPESPESWVAAAEEAKQILDDAEAWTQGKRLHGFDLAHVPNARCVLLAHGLPHFERGQLEELGPAVQVRVNGLLRQIENDAARVVALVHSHDVRAASEPWRRSSAPLFTLDACLGELVARCFALEFHDLLPGRRVKSAKREEQKDELRSAFTSVRSGLHKTGYFMRHDLLEGAESLAERIPLDTRSASHDGDRRLFQAL